ncbi:nitroreductase family protein [Methylophaga sp. OBS3]|uniref:nitroreductase family protein n=1 Tax=Methylophaga sp. OBS3 TaxID=2991934 RepID=UPI00225A9A27|nr:nitroreductase family protein [Methylophaga sp. OBS3]MCX4189093.1 nitroreductase family protein [Methylophaga sp. OBS3]
METLARNVISLVPGLKPLLKDSRDRLKRTVLRYRCFRYEQKANAKHMGWRHAGTVNYAKRSAELIFWYHKLEKGMCLPPENRRFFGQYPAQQTLTLLRKWEADGLSCDEPVYKAAIGVLEGYRDFVISIDNRTSEAEQILAEVNRFLSAHKDSDDIYKTPINFRPLEENAFEVLQSLALSRRSTRNFKSQAVPIEIVEKAAKLAQLSPSACNRQPWRVHLYQDKTHIEEMLKLQNGNRGFGHTIPMLAVMCCDMGAFFDATERNEPALDGGLFLMSFLYALQSMGLATCCLNWCVEPQQDQRGHEVGAIPENEKILTFLAIGYAADDTVVPLSARRPLTDLIVEH